MTLIEKKDRIEFKAVARGLAVVGARITEVERYSKMAEVSTGKIQVSFTIHKVEVSGVVRFYLTDSLSKVAGDSDNVAEMVDFLRKNGYLPEKEYQMANGMTEEAWAEWNA